MYADFTYYSESYGGKMTGEDWAVYGKRASAFLDYYTARRLRENLPTQTEDLEAVRNACCAVADGMKEVTDREMAIAEQNAAGGAIKSISSGGESVSYELSAIDKAITGGETTENTYYAAIAKRHMMWVRDDSGRPYLYRGVQ